MNRALSLALVVALALPAAAQPSDAPVLCKPGDVVLSPEAAVSAAARLKSAEAKVDVYEKHPPLPAWGVVLLVLAGVATGVAGSVIVYEVAKKP